MHTRASIVVPNWSVSPHSNFATRTGGIGMRRYMRMWSVLMLVLSVLVLSTTTASSADHDEVPFDVANVFFELNDTDGDLGIHALIDGEPWKNLEVEDPKANRMLNIRVNGRLRRQGLTELFFESAEPAFDELSPEAFFNRFPEGTYEIEGETLEGDELESEAEVTHLLPAPPENVLVSGEAEPEDGDCDEGPVREVSGPVVISWDEVTLSHPEIGRTGEPIEVVKYQVVVEREEPTTLVFSVDLPPDVRSLTVPADFIALSDAFKFEILVREASGNQTAVESCFEVNQAAP